jgi:hypothetical protein
MDYEAQFSTDPMLNDKTLLQYIFCWWW